MLKRPQPGILAQKDTEALRDLFAGRATRTRAPRSLLGGLLVCGLCGERMQARGPKYICLNHGGSVHLSIAKGTAEKAVLDQAGKHEPPKRRGLTNVNSPLLKERDALAAEVREINTDKDLPLSVVRQRVPVLEARIAEIDATLAAEEPAEDYDPTWEEFLSEWLTDPDDHGVDVVRAHLGKMVEKVTVGPAERRGSSKRKVEVTWR
jgi:hypothetical protein